MILSDYAYSVNDIQKLKQLLLICVHTFLAPGICLITLKDHKMSLSATKANMFSVNFDERHL